MNGIESGLRAAATEDSDARRRFADRLEEQTAGLRSFLRRRLSADVVDDAVQETLLRAWRHRASFDGARPLGPWLLTIATRTAHAVRRRTENQPDLPDMPTVDIPADSAERRETLDRLEAAMTELSEVARDVFVAFYREHQSVAQIATRFGLARGTVKSHLHRARIKLRRSLEDEP